MNLTDQEIFALVNKLQRVATIVAASMRNHVPPLEIPAFAMRSREWGGDNVRTGQGSFTAADFPAESLINPPSDEVVMDARVDQGELKAAMQRIDITGNYSPEFLFQELNHHGIALARYLLVAIEEQKSKISVSRFNRIADGILIYFDKNLSATQEMDGRIADLEGFFTKERSFDDISREERKYVEGALVKEVKGLRSQLEDYIQSLKNERRDTMA